MVSDFCAKRMAFIGQSQMAIAAFRQTQSSEQGGADGRSKSDHQNPCSGGTGEVCYVLLPCRKETDADGRIEYRREDPKNPIRIATFLRTASVAFLPLASLD